MVSTNYYNIFRGCNTPTPKDEAERTKRWKDLSRTEQKRWESDHTFARRLSFREDVTTSETQKEMGLQFLHHLAAQLFDVEHVDNLTA